MSKFVKFFNFELDTCKRKIISAEKVLIYLYIPLSRKFHLSFLLKTVYMIAKDKEGMREVLKVHQQGPFGMEEYRPK